MYWHNDDKPVTITAYSAVWADDGSPLPYRVKYWPGARLWRAYFEGSLLCEGSLLECLGACDRFDETGEPVKVGPEEVRHMLDASAEAAEANARLIAAAPDLLEACKLLLRCSLPRDVSGEAMVAKARAAIAKATD